VSSREGLTGAQLSSLIAGQNEALELAAAGAPLEDVLTILIHTAEAHSEGSFVGSILLMSEDGKRLLHGAAPSLPAAYNAAIHGIEIGPRVGSCGTAAYVGHSIFVADIASDELWKDFRDLALAHGLRACWSTPILGHDRVVLGTLALYYREPRAPTLFDREVVRFIANVAAILLENARLRSRRPG
jgi:GAF domain-containing protein